MVLSNRPKAKFLLVGWGGGRMEGGEGMGR